MNRKPDFIIGGAAKCATTWLRDALDATPGVFLPPHEPHFFSRGYSEDLAGYGELFADIPLRTVVGEKSNSYFSDPAAAARIARHLPDVRLIFQLRDPVARAYSDYCMLFRRGSVDGDIARHLDPERASGGRFLTDGRYAEHLERFFSLFGAEAILVLIHERTVQDPARHLAAVARHVGADPGLVRWGDEPVKDRRSAQLPRRLQRMLRPLRPVLDPLRHTAPLRLVRSAFARPVRYPALDSGLRLALEAFYRPEVQRLDALLDDDLSDVWPRLALTQERPAGARTGAPA